MTARSSGAALSDLRAELDAVRADLAHAVERLARQAITIQERQDDWHAMRAGRDAMVVENHKICDMVTAEYRRAERAWAQAQAVRAWATAAQTSPNATYVGIADHLLALLDAAPTATP